MKNIVYLWLVFESCLVLSLTQDIPSNDEDDELDQSESQKIPDSVLIQLKDVRNFNEFVERFVVLNETTDVLDDTSDQGSLVPLAGGITGPPISQHANCQPEDHIVELERPGSGTVMLYPSCVRIKRCGGCCPTKRLTCKPVSTSFINITARQIRYDPQKERIRLFMDEGIRTITLEQHDRCTCGCKIERKDCRPNVHVYKENECNCACVNQELSATCSRPKMKWDNTDCKCKCKKIPQCSTGNSFNRKSCKCETARTALNMDDDFDFLRK